MEERHQCTPAELGQVMDRYGTMVYRLAFSQLRNGTDADDIYQEVFLKYYRKRPKFESEEHRRAWLLRVTVNTAKSYVTSAWFRHTVALEECAVYQEPEEEQLSEALQMLKPGDRMLLHLFYYEGYSTEEIAHILGQRPGTVRSHLSRARETLRQKLKGADL